MIPAMTPPKLYAQKGADWSFPAPEDLEIKDETGHVVMTVNEGDSLFVPSIVVACNSHKALLDALNYVRRMTGFSNLSEHGAALCREAIRLAEEA